MTPEEEFEGYLDDYFSTRHVLRVPFTNATVVELSGKLYRDCESRNFYMTHPLLRVPRSLQAVEVRVYQNWRLHGGVFSEPANGPDEIYIPLTSAFPQTISRDIMGERIPTSTPTFFGGRVTRKGLQRCGWIALDDQLDVLNYACEFVKSPREIIAKQLRAETRTWGLTARLNRTS